MKLILLILLSFSFPLLEAKYDGLYSYEAEKNESSVSLYIDRGDFHFDNHQLLDALENYQHYLSRTQNSDKSNLIRAICGKLFCYLLLYEDELGEKEFQHLVTEVATIGDDIYNLDCIKNSYAYQYYKENIKDYKKQPCPCAKKNQLIPKQTLEIPSDTPEEHCLLQCNGFAVACYVACGRVANLFIQGMCIGCIFGLEQVCIRCCKGDGFWKNCVTPLRRLFHDPEHPENPAPSPYE